jgi:TonB family protein
MNIGTSKPIKKINCLRLVLFLITVLTISADAYGWQTVTGTPCCGNKPAGPTLQDSAIKSVEPSRPLIAKILGIKGQVVVEVAVNEQGDVIETRALTGHSWLKQSAMRAARQWKFRPTTLNGKAVRVIGQIILEFGRKREDKNGSG